MNIKIKRRLKKNLKNIIYLKYMMLGIILILSTSLFLNSSLNFQFSKLHSILITITILMFVILLMLLVILQIIYDGKLKLYKNIIIEYRIRRKFHIAMSLLKNNDIDNAVFILKTIPNYHNLYKYLHISLVVKSMGSDNPKLNKFGNDGFNLLLKNYGLEIIDNLNVLI